MQNLELNHGEDSMGKKVSMKTLIWQGNDFIECKYFGILYNTHMPGAKATSQRLEFINHKKVQICNLHIHT